jgi:hypothetical protein
MAIKRYTADADTTITNAYKANLSTRGVSGNMGQSDILEVFSIYAQANTSSSELERILIKFPVTGSGADYISYDRAQNNIPASGSVSFYLRMFNAKHSQTVPKDFNLIVSAVSQSWQEGLGLDMEDYSDEDEANWVYRNDTKTAQVITASFASDTRTDYGGKYISLYDTNDNRYNFWFNDGDDSAPTVDGTEVEVDISAGSTAANYATTFKAIVDAHSQFIATVSSATSGVKNATKGVATLPTGNVDVISLTTTTMGADYTSWANEGADYFVDASSSFTASFGTGFEDMELDITPLVEQWINSPGNEAVLGSKSNYGVGVRLSSTEEGAADSYYTKKFFARGSQFFFKRPYIEARWDSSTKDNRGSFYYSSSLAPAADNLNTIYLYNYVRGQLKNIPDIGTGSILVSIYSGSSNNSAPSGSKLTLSAGGGVVSAADTNVTGGYVSTGLYSASFSFTGSTSLTRVFDVWHSSSTEYFTGTINPASLTQVWPGQAFNPNQQYISKITNLKTSYSNQNTTARLRLYTRKKDWNPNIYSVASLVAPIDLVEDAYYKVFRADDGLDVISYGTGSDNNTRLSYDTSGSYFDLDMSLLEADYTYAIKFIYYLNSQYTEQPEQFNFRVENV